MLSSFRMAPAFPPTPWPAMTERTQHEALVELRLAIENPDEYLRLANARLDQAGVPHRFRRFNKNEAVAVLSARPAEAAAAITDLTRERDEATAKERERCIERATEAFHKLISDEFVMHGPGYIARTMIAAIRSSESAGPECTCDKCQHDRIGSK